jgi:hypothetical protein
MTYLVAWRNPQGREEVWMRQPQTFPGLARRCICEIGFGAVVVTAVVESIAYGAISLLTLTVYPLTDRPFEYAVKLLQSSSFTILWALADMIFNWFFYNLMTHESFARSWAELPIGLRTNYTWLILKLVYELKTMEESMILYCVGSQDKVLT